MSISRKSKYLSLIALAIVLGVGARLGMHGHIVGSAQAVAGPTPAAEVDVAAIVSKRIVDWQSYSGRLQAIDHVDVHALVPGTIMAVYFKDGELVKQGAALFLIDPRPYAAALQQAAAQVAAARARARFAATDYARAQKLIADNATSTRDLEAKANEASEAEANVKAAEAEVQVAQVNLGYTKIMAPVSGRMSRAELTVGNIVAAGNGSPPLTTLVSVSPMYASFDVDEQTYLEYLSRGSKSAVPVRLGLANETGYSRMGKISSVDNELNSTSGTIRVRATFENPDGALLPGLYARVEVGSGEPHPAVLIDDRAVSTDQAKKYVLVVDDNNHAQYREVTLGGQSEGFRVVASGLRPGERIVVSGLQRLHPGDEVKANLVPMSGENTVAAR